MNDYEGIDHVKKLWILEQVVLTKSLKAAALRAKVTPPAVSQAISALEKVVGKPLLIRKRSGIEPTETALELVRTAAPALLTLSRLAKSTQAQVPSMTWMSFGTYESLSVSLLPGLITSLKKQLPEMKLTLRVARTGSLAAMVRKGELCAALVSESDSFGRLTVTPLATDRLGLYANTKTHKKIGSVTDASELTGYQIGTLVPGQDGLPRYYQKFIEQTLGTDVKPTLLSDSFEALRAATVQGPAISILPERVALRTPGELKEIRFSSQKSSQLGAHQICLISLPTCDQGEIQFLKKELGSLLQAEGYSAL